MMIKDQHTIGKCRLSNSENLNNNNAKAVTAHACFVAGTLVHTDIVSIQELKVGDRVLSKPESGEGKAEYKPVLSTFKSQQKEKIYKVEYYNETADERGEKSTNYILCSALHPFWVSKTPTTDIDAKLEGEWLAAEDLPSGILTSAHGDGLWLDDYSFLPVRTLPNFPEGCAYMQSIDHHDEGWNGVGNIEFVKFNHDSYQFVSLSDTEEGFNKEIETLNIKTSDSIFKVNEKEPFLIDSELYKTLNVRLIQDLNSNAHTLDKFINFSNSPLIVNGVVVRERRVTNENSYEKGKFNIEKYGDNTGLLEESIHHNIAQYYDECPNPYEDYVYNIEVADHHTYFVGHDAVWVHNCDPSTLNAK